MSPRKPAITTSWIKNWLLGVWASAPRHWNEDSVLTGRCGGRRAHLAQGGFRQRRFVLQLHPPCADDKHHVRLVYQVLLAHRIEQRHLVNIVVVVAVVVVVGAVVVVVVVASPEKCRTATSICWTLVDGAAAAHTAVQLQ